VQELHAAVLRGRIYVAGGITPRDRGSIRVYRLDSAASGWERVADLPAPRHHMPLAVANDTLYAIGGLGPGGFSPVATLWLYDERADGWHVRAPLPEPRGASAAAVADGRIVVVGGFGAGMELSDSTVIYDPGADRWSHAAGAPTPRDHLAAVRLGGEVFAVGGQPLPTPRHGVAAAVLAGRIYLIGGGPRAGGAQTDVVEVFTP
jgi:N-acetylneuraminic acid mutarotase